MDLAATQIPLNGLLSNRVIFESDNADEVRSQIGRYFKPHNMRFLDERSRQLRTSLRRSRIGSIAINVLEYGGNVMIDPGQLEDFYLIHLNLAGECEITHEGGHMTVHSTHAAVCSPHRPYRFWWQPKSCALAIQIPKKRLMSHLRDITGIVPRDEIDFDFALDLDTPETRSFADFIQYLLNDTDNLEGLTSDPVTAEPLEKSLMTALLRAQPGSHQAAMSAVGGCPAPAYVTRAETHMRDNLHRSIRLEELANIGDVTERTLTSGFRRFRGETPARYFLALRLAEARRRLLESNANETVSDIAFELGFHHLSSFAGAFRERYDEPPSQVLRRTT